MVYGVENERNEEYSYTFIALHKKFRLRDIVQTPFRQRKSASSCSIVPIDHRGSSTILDKLVCL